MQNSNVCSLTDSKPDNGVVKFEPEGNKNDIM